MMKRKLFLRLLIDNTIFLRLREIIAKDYTNTYYILRVIFGK